MRPHCEGPALHASFHSRCCSEVALANLEHMGEQLCLLRSKLSEGLFIYIYVAYWLSCKSLLIIIIIFVPEEYQKPSRKTEKPFCCMKTNAWFAVLSTSRPPWTWVPWADWKWSRQFSVASSFETEISVAAPIHALKPGRRSSLSMRWTVSLADRRLSQFATLLAKIPKHWSRRQWVWDLRRNKTAESLIFRAATRFIM